MALVRRGATPAELLDELKPLTTRSVELKDRIRRKTPWRRLDARRTELLRALPAMPDGRERSKAEMEIAQLDAYLANPRRKPMTLAALVLFAAVVFVTVVLPPWIVRWLAP